LKNNYLIDTNFLISLVLSTHPHHPNSIIFYSQAKENDTFGICRSVQISFLRLLTQKLDPSYKPLNNAEAISEFQKLMEVPNFIFIEDTQISMKGWTSYAQHRNSAPHLWMDAYLAYFASQNKLVLLTYDKGFLQWQNRGLKVKLLS
jgi:toxin-antitoxin system PIN domain toxin